MLQYLTELVSKDIDINFNINSEAFSLSSHK